MKEENILADQKRTYNSQAWCSTPVTPAAEKVKQGDSEFDTAVLHDEFVSPAAFTVSEHRQRICNL